MIGRLTGRIVELSPGEVVLDVGGVGYELRVPVSAHAVLSSLQEVTVFVHTHVREDQIALYGFLTTLELQLFERLIAVSGIGPKLALAALSGIEPGELVRAVRTADVARLSSIPGIGKKTAERISLELKDKLPASLVPGVPVAGAPAGDGAMRDDLLSALLNLGYQRAGAEKAVDAALKAPPGSPPPAFEQALRAALRGMSR